MVGQRNIMPCTEVCTQAKVMAAHERLHVSVHACAPLPCACICAPALSRSQPSLLRGYRVPSLQFSPVSLIVLLCRHG